MAGFISRALGLLYPVGAPAVVEPGGFTMVESRHRGGTTRLALSGDVDLRARDRLRDGLLAASTAPTARVCVDLDGARFLDCSGIGALVAGPDAAVAAGCGFRLVHAHGIAARVRDVTGVGVFLGGEDRIRGMVARWRRRPPGRTDPSQ